MSKIGGIIASAAALGFVAGAMSAHAAPAVKNIVLVHGAFVDGSGWEGVYKILKKDGYNVSIVQNPTTSLADDVAATKRVLATPTDLQSLSVIPMAARSSPKPATIRR